MLHSDHPPANRNKFSTLKRMASIRTSADSRMLAVLVKQNESWFSQYFDTIQPEFENI